MINRLCQPSHWLQSWSLLHPHYRHRVSPRSMRSLFSDACLVLDESSGMVQVVQGRGSCCRNARLFSSASNDKNKRSTNQNSSILPSTLAAEKSSSSSNEQSLNHGFVKSTVYVHPLSQIILEYLQDCHHAWIVRHGLDQSLTLHRDGSFVLKFRRTQVVSESSPRTDEARVSVWSQVASGSKQDQKDDVDRIWTSYDEEEKKHWLMVQKQSLHQRFLLQDNLLSAWHGNKKSLPERIHLSVDTMIRAVDRLDVVLGQQQPMQGK
jgi:hypothetical protein